jgi:hypothetical protein
MPSMQSRSGRPDLVLCDLEMPALGMEVECDVPEGGTIRFHLACYDVWQTILTGKDCPPR